MQARDFERAAQRPWWLALLLAAFVALLSACSDSPAPAPTIGVQPSDTSAMAGSAATLSVIASGPDITYQWQVSTDGGSTWTNLAGATQASYTTPPTTPADSGKRYRVVVSAAGISVNSSAVQLTVTAAVVAPTLTVQPAAQTATAPDAATFSVTAGGTAPIYQWQRSTDGGTTFVAIAGATAASYSTGATTTAMNGERYRVVVANSAGSVTSSAVELTVNPTPVAAAITAQPANQSVTAGSAAAFTVAATGTPAPTLQWQRSTDGGATFADIAGATDPTFNTGLTAVAQNGELYRAVATNSAGSATSNAATLTVNPAPQAPAITTQPTAQTVTAPATATFSAAATGVPTPTWQWQLSIDGGTTFANITGATGASYTTPATSTADSGRRYRAVASNASGSATTSAVTLTVNAAAAGPVRLNATNTPGDATHAQVAVDAAGNALVVWQQSDAATTSIWANRYSAATDSWGTAEPIESDSAAATAPQIAVDASGNALAVWARNDGATTQVWTNRYTPGQGWGVAAVLGTSGGAPRIAMNPAGNAFAVWNQFSGGDVVVWASRYTAGSGWSVAAVIETGNGNSGGDPWVAVDANGNAMLVLLKWNGVRTDMYAKRFLASAGAWSAAVPIETDNAGSVQEGRIVIDADGNAMAVWRYFDGTRYAVMANRFSAAAGAWDSAALNLNPTGDSADARIAFDANGNALAVWSQWSGTGTTYDIHASRYTAGVGWSAPEVVQADTAGDAFESWIAFDGSGNAHAVWRRADGARLNIWAGRYAPGAGWGAATLLETDNAGNAVRPHLTVDGNGNAIAVWEQSDGSRRNVWARRFR